MSIYAEISCDGKEQEVTVEITEEGELFFIDYDIEDDIAEEMMGSEPSWCLRFAQGWDTEPFPDLIWMLMQDVIVGLSLETEMLSDLFMDIGFQLIERLSDELAVIDEMYEFDTVNGKEVGSEQYVKLVSALQEAAGMHVFDFITSDGVEFLRFYTESTVPDDSRMEVESFLHLTKRVADHISRRISVINSQNIKPDSKMRLLSQSWNALAQFTEMFTAHINNASYIRVKDKLKDLFKLVELVVTHAYSLEVGYSDLGHIPDVVWEKIKSRRDRALIGGAVSVIEGHIDAQQSGEVQ